MNATNGPAGLRRVGLLGGGVIGGGWAARFLLNGVDVVLYDPAADAERKVGEMLANARRAYARMTMAPLPAEGRLAIVDNVAAAATGVDFIQESAPEQLALKRSLLAEAAAVAPPDVVIGSSTSGLLPSLLQEGIAAPERLVVGHPFNPVYLLPLVEVCGGAATTATTLDRAVEVYSAIGMHPLRLSREIDGFVADRLLEALWREALWLVADGVATVGEIDDAIRFGAGLRWSFMGTFLTYRIAGGEAGMRHFMAQFGPALHWPWTKLTEVPELTDELLDRLVAQSDEQAGGASVRELEALRDDCLIHVLHGLRAADYGAGRTLAEFEHRLFERAPLPPTETTESATGALRVWTRRIPTDWIDYNGHVNDSRYYQLSSEGGDAFLRLIGLDAEYLASGRSLYTVDSHLCFLGQLHAGDVVHVELQVLSLDAKRIGVFTTIHRDDGEVVTTAEHTYLHVDTVSAKASPIGDELLARLGPIAEAHASLPRPASAGLRVGERPPR